MTEKSTTVAPETFSRPLVVFGASDDLIEVGGAIEAEFGAYSRDIDEPAYVGFSNGLLVKVWYGDRPGHDESVWNVQPLNFEGRFDLIPARGEDAGRDEDGCPGYSDKLIVNVTEPITWAVTGVDVEAQVVTR